MKKVLLTTALSFILTGPSLAMDEAESAPMPRVEDAITEVEEDAGQGAMDAVNVVEDSEAVAEDAQGAVEVMEEEVSGKIEDGKIKEIKTAKEEITLPGAAMPEPVEGGAKWGYDGAVAAPYWGTLDPSYSVCAAGHMQSPINIAKFLQEDLPDIVPAYKPSPLSVLNTGHTIQLNFQPGSGFSKNGMDYALMSASFHTPSEHYLDGAPYPMELQFLHKASDGTLAVLAVMVKLGEHNKVVEGVWQNTPIEAGAEKIIDSVEINAADLLPQSLEYYAYDGSLTSPPCTEGVRWHVLKEPIEVSEKQLKAFQALFPVNARPVQDLNERVVTGD